MVCGRAAVVATTERSIVRGATFVAAVAGRFSRRLAEPGTIHTRGDDETLHTNSV